MTTNLQLVWTWIAAGRVEAILRMALGREELEGSNFRKGLTGEGRVALMEGRSAMDEKSAKGWLRLFETVWKMA